MVRLKGSVIDDAAGRILGRIAAANQVDSLALQRYCWAEAATMTLTCMSSAPPPRRTPRTGHASR